MENNVPAEQEQMLKDLAVLRTLPIASWQYPRILIGIPLERSISFAEDVFWPFMRLAAQGPAFIEAPYTTRIDVMRNQYVKKLLMSTFTHLLMLDIDHIHPDDIVQRLAKWVIMFPEMKVISGLNFRRKPPYDPVAGNLTDTSERPILFEWEQGLMKVDEVGAASLLVERSVFETMPPRWFENVYEDPWKETFPGEDIGFCHKCREHNIPIYVDTTTSSPHCTGSLVTEETFRNFVAEHREDFGHVQYT